MAALGLILLAPTFSALNASYFTDVPPPPWMPPPDELPDITPPTMTPPTGFTPPTGYEGPVPPPMCPPPVLRRLEESNRTFSMEPRFSPDASWRETVEFDVPDGALVLGGYVNFTNWQARQVRVVLSPPEGGESWSQSEEGNTGFLAQPTPESSFEYNSYEENNQQPPAVGTWTVTLQAELPLGGEVSTIFGVVLACGGLMS